MPGTEIRRKDRQGSTAEAMNQLATAEVGYLSMTLEDGHPYVVPMNFALEGNTIFMHSALTGQKVTALQRDNRVCFLVSEFIELVTGSVPCEYGAKFASSLVFGKAAFLNGEEKLHALSVLSLKYAGMAGPFRNGEADKIAVIAVTIESLSHKRRH
jgi:uncharacterized protein